ncbi:MAG: hypothetical protein GXO50_02980 [Chlorobi bacterium]|nr:hypothetical protein [Chlorobiota bacterium]
MSIKTFVFTVLLSNIVFFSSCDENTGSVPDVYVDIYLEYIDSDPQYSDLRTTGGYIYITGGVSGIIVYRSSPEEFRAYDRACPYDPDCGRVTVDDANFYAVDTLCCGSKFSLLLDGAVSQGPAQFPLKQYNCIYDPNTQVLHIKN